MDQRWREHNPFGRLRDYELKHFVADLEERGPHDKLHRVFLLEDETGRNAWYEAKSARGGSAAFLADVQRAWGVLKQQNRDRLEAGQPPDLATEFRYAVTVAALTSAASRAPWLIVELARYGLTSPEEAVTAALQERDSFRRVVALTELGVLLEGDSRLAAQKAALAEIAESHRERANRTSVRAREDDNDASESSIDLRRTAAECMIRLVPALADALIAALDTAREVAGLWRFHAMKAVLPRLDPAQRAPLADELWESAGRYRAGYWRAEAQAIAAPLASETERDARMRSAAAFAVDILGDEQARRYRLQDSLTGALLISAPDALIRREDLRALREIAPFLTLDQWKLAESRAAALRSEYADAARSVLVPQLSRLTTPAQALAAAEAIVSPYYRGLARASALWGRIHPASGLQPARRWFEEAGELTDAAERALCRAALARGPGIEAALDDISQAGENLRPHALQDLTPALAASGKPPTVQRALEMTLKVVDRQGISGSLVACGIAACLKAPAVEDWRRRESGVEWKTPPAELLQRMKESAAAAPIPDPPGFTGLPAAQLVEVLRKVKALPPVPYGRAITLAAQFAGEPELDSLAALTAAIRHEYARSFAWLGLTQRAQAAQRRRFALELLRTLFAVNGGLSGADAFFLSSAGLGQDAPDVYDALSRFAASLSQESPDTALADLAHPAALYTALAGEGALSAIADGIALVDRWWGKPPAPESKPAPAPAEPRFAWRGIAPSAQETGVELLRLLTRAREFDAAREILLLLRAAPGWESAAERGLQTLLTECAAAGRFRQLCQSLLDGVETLSADTASTLARAYIQYGRTKEAFGLLPLGNAWPAAAEIIESFAAEEQWIAALDLFDAMTISPVTPETADNYVTACFIVGNGAMKNQDIKMLRRFERVVHRARYESAEVMQQVRTRLDGMAALLARRGHTGRAEAWRLLLQLMPGS